MDTYVKEFEGQLGGIFLHLKQELQGVRSSRPSPQLVEDIQVEYFGQRMPIKQLGSLSIRPPRDILITVWDQNAVQPVMKAIQDSKVGLSLSNEGNVVRGSLPPLTQERRTELGKLIKRIAEDVRIRIRHTRDEANKKIKSAESSGELTEDAAFKVKEGIQKVVGGTNKKIEDLLEAKLKELQE